MTIDEQIVECVLGILENKRVSNKIYEIVNKSPTFSKPLISVPKVVRVPGKGIPLENIISKYKDDNIKLNQTCSEQKETISEIEADNKTLLEKNSQLESQLGDYQQLCIQKEQIEKDYTHLQEELEKIRQELVQQQNKYASFVNRPQKVRQSYQGKIIQSDQKRFWSLLLCCSVSVFDRRKSIKLKLDTLVVIPIYVICKFRDKMLN